MTWIRNTIPSRPLCSQFFSRERKTAKKTNAKQRKTAKSCRHFLACTVKHVLLSSLWFQRHFKVHTKGSGPFCPSLTRGALDARQSTLVVPRSTLADATRNRWGLWSSTLSRSAPAGTWALTCQGERSLRAQRLKQFKISLWDWKFSSEIEKDAAFLLTVGSFLLTVELFYLQLLNLAFLLTIGAFLLTILAFYLQLELFCLQWDSAVNKGLKGL